VNILHISIVQYEREVECTYGVKVELEGLSRSAHRGGAIVLQVGVDVSQRNAPDRSSKNLEVRVTLVQLCDLGLSIGLEERVAGEGDGIGRGSVVEVDGRSTSH